MRLAFALVLASALPAFAESGDRGASFVALVRQNGCEMTEKAAEKLLGGAGYSADETQGFAASLLASGRAEMSEDGTTFRLSKDFCAADPAQDAALFNGIGPNQAALNRVRALGMPGVRAVIAMFVMERKCTVELDGARDVRADMTDTVLIRSGIDAPRGSLARAEAEKMVREAVANPGKAYKVDNGWLTLIHCKA